MGLGTEERFGVEKRCGRSEMALLITLLHGTSHPVFGEPHRILPLYLMMTLKIMFRVVYVIPSSIGV